MGEAKVHEGQGASTALGAHDMAAIPAVVTLVEEPKGLLANPALRHGLIRLPLRHGLGFLHQLRKEPLITDAEPEVGRSAEEGQVWEV